LSGAARPASKVCSGLGILQRTPQHNISVDCEIGTPGQGKPGQPRSVPVEGYFEEMANTTSAKKATRKIARRTVSTRRAGPSCAPRCVRRGSDQSGDRNAAGHGDEARRPELMKAAQHDIIPPQQREP